MGYLFGESFKAYFPICSEFTYFASQNLRQKNKQDQNSNIGIATR